MSECKKDYIAEVEITPGRTVKMKLIKFKEKDLAHNIRELVRCKIELAKNMSHPFSKGDDFYLLFFDLSWNGEQHDLRGEYIPLEEEGAETDESPK